MTKYKVNHKNIHFTFRMPETMLKDAELCAKYLGLDRMNFIRQAIHFHILNTIKDMNRK